MAPPLIELRRLTKVYHEGERSHTVLQEVNLTIQAGEFVVLLGRSGSGTSTLLNLISGIDLPTSEPVACSADGRFFASAAQLGSGAEAVSVFGMPAQPLRCGVARGQSWQNSAPERNRTYR